jgi:hypothetical protein
VTKTNCTLDNVNITEKDDNTHTSGWKFLMTATGKRKDNGASFKEERGH